MAQSYLDRERARILMQAAGLDGIVVSEPESFQYVTGVPLGVAAMFRRAGAAFAVVPADPARPIGAVVGDLGAEDFRREVPGAEVRTHPLWIETVEVTGAEPSLEAAVANAWASRPAGFARPTTFDLRGASEALQDVLGALRLPADKVGFDLDFVAANDAAGIAAVLGTGPLRDGSGVLDRLRMVKAPGEIAKLRLGAELAEAGIRELARTAAEGQTATELRAAFRAGVAAEAARRGAAAPPSWEYIAIGPEPWRPGGRVAAGAIIKVDVGCVIDGYSSDTSRNFVFGAPTAAQSRLHEILERAFAAGQAAIGPGRPFSGVHGAVTRSLEASGLTGFSRGHFGHGLGQSYCSEQWPFISADATIDFEPGMVVAFEAPVYVTGVGGFNLEDQLLITPDGFESMNTLPRELVSVGAGA